jgi:hypothetical protein
MKEPTPSPPPLSPAATLAMVLTGHGADLPHERENCGEEEPGVGAAAATVAMMSMLSIEVVVDEVEPHIVQVAYRQVCASMADINHFLYHLLRLLVIL